jgi:hypothetical protein
MQYVESFKDECNVQEKLFLCLLKYHGVKTCREWRASFCVLYFDTRLM